LYNEKMPYAFTVRNSLIQVDVLLLLLQNMVEERQEQLEFTVTCEWVDYAGKGGTVLNQLLGKLV
jgi:hypothetical protein